ncbi:acyltransferase family-domain-containing protein [Microdochium trichocladiopsis]|uniref:Acyltransferase family-domain-containing protein n=1 Tax=Microdochium trichocladiopsis TaxID=1682393 RepID=A0A9P9BKK3_9PEZI|nr:acyltransferase family-domain-containing protein [Microdochium trichocladiopsis]KAH7018616.1 acyltransferase family-domain-containing protein [Microdochium trichocladiopsis]
MLQLPTSVPLQPLVSLNGSQDSTTNPNPPEYLEDFQEDDDYDEGWGLLQDMSKSTPSPRWVKLEQAAKVVGSWTLAAALQLVPSFLRFQKPASPTPTVTTSPAKKLASLDGIRGIACLIVFNFHFLYPYTLTVIHGFNPDSNGEHVYAHQYPFLCLVARGRAAVCVFFAVSGYVLSHRFIQLVRQRNLSKAHSSLASLTFRRGMRLFLPPTFSIIIIALAAWLGAYEPGWKLKGSPWQGGEWEPNPDRRPDLGTTLRDLYYSWWDWSNPWNWNPMYIEYDPHLWTIPIEFRSSMVLFLALLGTASLRGSWRGSLLWIGCVYCLWYGRWDVGVFLGGAVMAELHLYIASRSSPWSWRTVVGRVKQGIGRGRLRLRVSSSSASTAPRVVDLEQGSPEPTTKPRTLMPLSIFFTTCLVLILLSSLFFLSYPDARGSSTPGFTVLSQYLTPRAFGDGKYLFWHAVGSILFIFSVPLLPRLAAWVFENPVAQYLGRISYALYLCHGPVMHSLGFAVQPLIFKNVVGVYIIEPEEGATAGRDAPVQWAGGQSGWCLGLLLGWFMCLVITIFVADIFWRSVDVGCVKLARAVEMAMVRPPEKITGAESVASDQHIIPMRQVS